MKSILAALTFFAVIFVHAESAAPKINFEKKHLKVGGVPILTEIADTPEKAARGMMYRTKMADGEAMLFVFNNNQIRSFWMKNTFIPLSIGFFDDKKRLVDMQDMEPVKSEMDKNPPVYESKKEAQYALEVPKGWFKKNKIKIGAEITGF